MPGVLPIYKRLAEGDDKWQQTTNELGDKERDERKAWIDQAEKYYEGEHKRPLKNEKDGTNSSVLLNLTGQALDDMVEYLGTPTVMLPDGIQREPGQAGEDGKRRLTLRRTPDQSWLEQWWEDLELPEFVVDVALSGFIAGHSFIRLWNGAPEDREDVEPVAALLDPRYVTVFWDISNVRRVLWYRLSWKVGDDARRQDIVPSWLAGANDPVTGEPLDVQGWWIFEYGAKSDGKWTEIGADWWPWPFPPIVEWKNRHAPHHYYGRSDVRLPLNDAINFTASNTAKIIKHHGGPQTIVTGAALGDDVVTGPGTVIDDLPPEAKVYNLEMQSDLNSSLAFLDRLEARFFSQAHVVDMATIKDKLGQITNFGVRMLFIRTINMMTIRRRLYGKGIAEITRRALAMRGVAVERVDVEWPEMLPVDRKELVDTLDKERTLGTVSKQSATEDLGRDFDVEQERIDEEDDDAADATQRVLEKQGNQGLFR